MSTEGDLSSLSTDQVNLLITIERTCASFSMVAIILITTSFTAFKRLRTTPNLFIVFASLANAGASVASMMGYDGLVKGDNSTLCQAQAFIFEWYTYLYSLFMTAVLTTVCRFMQSDPWWSFAMAFNVFLVFFCNVDPTAFRKCWWAYCIACFGGPLIPAVVLISIRDDSRGPVFGDATVSKSDLHMYVLVTDSFSTVVVLDRISMGSCSPLRLLYSNLDMHIAIHNNIYCSWIPCISTS